jgi:adhesin HecA-like repeat protein
LDNTGGTLNAGSLNIATTGDLINTDGKLTSASGATLTGGRPGRQHARDDFGDGRADRERGRAR